jgi:hypothetical protein
MRRDDGIVRDLANLTHSKEMTLTVVCGVVASNGGGVGQGEKRHESDSLLVDHHNM